jgi:hypothetical protein
LVDYSALGQAGDPLYDTGLQVGTPLPEAQEEAVQAPGKAGFPAPANLILHEQDLDIGVSGVSQGPGDPPDLALPGFPMPRRPALLEEPERGAQPAGGHAQAVDRFDVPALPDPGDLLLQLGQPLEGDPGAELPVGIVREARRGKISGNVEHSI